MRRFLLPCLLALLIVIPRSDAGKESAEHAKIPPKLIMIIRHGEKPAEVEKGEKDPNLSPRGYERAAALVHVIPDNFGKPDFLFATHKSAHSDRPSETITPLSRQIKESIDDEFKDDQFSELAKKILDDPKYSGKVILISWHHGKIPELAHALGAADAPAKWDSKVFDRVWEVKFDDGKVTFQDLPEKALPGDSQK